MPRHANQTSFKKGHKRLASSIAQQSETMRQQFANGERTPPRKPSGRQDKHPPRQCEHCGNTYTPASGRQQWCQTCAPNEKARHIMRRYHISQAEWDQMYADQLGLCAICTLREASVFDHCHTTGNVRALLCNPCNVLLGIAETTPDILDRFAKYIEKGRPQLYAVPQR